jgi:hypothetical protein
MNRRRSPWVRYLDGRLVVTWRDHSGWLHDRPLRLRERIAWRLVRRVPTP